VTVALYLIGPPGVGKSSALAVLQRRLAFDPPTLLWGSLLRGQVWRRAGLTAGIRLGVPRDKFGGTDGLSMGVHPQAVDWAQNGRLPKALVGEGQRLATVAFLSSLAERCDLTVAHLTASQDTLDARCAARGSNQAPAWRMGAAHRAANLAAVLTSRCPVVVLNTDRLSPWDVGVTLGKMVPEVT
jgi:adenylate kinase family enzyme